MNGIGSSDFDSPSTDTNCRRAIGVMNKDLADGRRQHLEALQQSCMFYFAQLCSAVLSSALRHPTTRGAIIGESTRPLIKPPPLTSVFF